MKCAVPSPPKVSATPSFNRNPLNPATSYVVSIAVTARTVRMASWQKGTRRMMCAQKTTNIAGAHDGTGKRAGFDVADWVAFSATPIFAIMAVLTAVVSSGSMDRRRGLRHKGRSLQETCDIPIEKKSRRFRRHRRIISVLSESQTSLREDASPYCWRPRA
jgi:hypothetical protein